MDCMADEKASWTPTRRWTGVLPLSRAESADRSEERHFPQFLYSRITRVLCGLVVAGTLGGIGLMNSTSFVS